MTKHTANQDKLTFTDRAFVRSHGRSPRGTGCWAFCRTTTQVAFEADLLGEVEFYSGTLTEAKAALKADGGTGLWAVMP